jgi:hypothetical protein
MPGRHLVPVPAQAAGTAVSTWRRALLCLGAVLASAVIALIVAVTGGSRWAAAAAATSALAIVTGVVGLEQKDLRTRADPRR